LGLGILAAFLPLTRYFGHDELAGILDNSFSAVFLLSLAFSDFTLRRARQEFNLTIVEQPTFLLPTEPIPPSPFLRTFLDKHLPFNF
jgi:hypothetical protein